MIKHFIAKKVGEKVFTKALQGDKRGLMRYLKICIAIVVIGIILIIVLTVTAIIFLAQLIGSLFTSLQENAGAIRQATEVKIEEKVNTAKTITPERLHQKIEEVKEKATPHTHFLQEGEGALKKLQEAAQRLENLLP